TDQEHRRTGQRLFGLQTWVALPEALEESDPEFTHLAADALPTVEDEGFRARVIAGRAFGKTSPPVTASETLHADIELAAGVRFAVEPSVAERALYTISGEIEISGQ